MRRREFLALAAALAGAPVSAHAQRLPLVAIVGIGDLSRFPLSVFVEGLRAAGYEPGKNVELLPPAPTGRGYAALEPLAATAVARRADVIFAWGDTAAHAAKAATRSIPIVMAINTDAVERGLVGNLARPDGNITGVAGRHQFLVAKRIELLREIAPRIRRLGAIAAGSESQQLSLKLIQATAAKLGIAVESAQIGRPEELDAALSALAAKRVDALTYTPAAVFAQRVPEIVRWAAERKVPVVYNEASWVRAGGLISYSPDFAAMLPRAASYVARVLKGAKPSELPVEQAEKFELAINLKTAAALGIKVPYSLLVRADEAIL